MANGQFQPFNAFGKNAGRPGIPPHLYPVVSEIAAVIGQQGHLPPVIMSLKTGSNPILTMA